VDRRTAGYTKRRRNEMTTTEKVQEYIKKHAGDRMTYEQIAKAARWVMSKNPQPSWMSYNEKRRQELQLQACKSFIRQVWAKFVTPIESGSSGFTQEDLNKL
jgi:hypothetical protein